jgi:hypothetical protein
MPNNTNPNYQLTSNYIEVKQEINIKIGDGLEKATASYAIFIKKEQHKKYDIEVTRSKFLINEQEIENKFSSISNHYFSCLFPMQFKIDEQNKLVVVNFDDINNRIQLKDLFFSENTEGEGLKHIRDQFFEQTSTNQKIQTLISSLGIVTLIELSLLRYSQNPATHVQWVIPMAGATHWTTELKKNETNNSLTIASSKIDKEALIENVNNYIHLHELNLTREAEENEIFSTFETHINYMGSLLTLSDLQTNINIKVGDYFEYQETTTLLSTIDK